MKKKIILTIIAVCILVVVLVFLKINAKAKDEGKVRIIIKDNEIIVDEYVDYHKNDTLAEILEDKYDGIFRNDNVLISLKGIETNFIDNYWAFYINDEYATIGIKECRLENDNTYTFEVKEI